MAADFLYEPPQTERTVSVRLGSPPNSLKLSTISHVVAGGLPVSATHLKRVKDGLVAGLYDSDREALIREVKYDPGLFVYCVRQAPNVAGTTERPVDVFTELRSWPQEKLLQLLNVDRHAITRHMMVHSNILQASILQHLLLCISAVEVIAPKVRIDPEAAHTVSVFREIGDALVAWNYYETYSRVLSNHRRFGSDIEAEWVRLLGVTPHRIGMTLADDWKLPSNVRFAFQQHGKQADSVAAITGGGEPALHALAILVDIIAQLHDPVHYPDGPQLWAAAEAEVTKILGGGLIKEIDAHARPIFALYEQEVPALGKLVFAQSVYRKTPDPRAIPRAPLAKTNPYVPRCPESVHARFQQVYGCLGNASQLTGAIRIFEEQLVADCGFTRGCLYLLDAAKGMLYPTLSFGDRSLEAYPSYSATEDNEFSAFLRNAIPYRSTAADAAGLEVDRIIGGLNSPAHPGVLYLELGTEFGNDSSSDPLLMFHALRATINDILSIK